MHSDEIALVPLAALAIEPAVPAEADRGLDGNTHGACGQNLAAVGVGLLFKQLPARHRDDPRANAIGFQQILRRHCDRDLGARGHQDGAAFAFGLGQDIAALRGHVLGRVLRAHSRQALAGQCQHRRRGPRGQRQLPGLGCLYGIRRAEDVHIRRRTQHGQMFDRLVRRPVLAQTDGIVGHDIRNPQAHQ